MKGIVINFVNGDRLHDNYDEHTKKYELVNEHEKQKYLELYSVNN